LLGKVTVKALNGLSLKIKEGEFVSVIGSSGSGKSTAMHLMGFLDVPSSGKILFKGKDVSHFSRDELARLRRDEIGFVFQTFNLMRSSNAVDNVLLALFQVFSLPSRLHS